MWWDQQTDGEHLYPKEQRNPTPEQIDHDGRFNPEEAASRGLWNDPKFLETVSEMNPKLRKAQFSDYHGHGWMFQKVYKRDRKGNFLDADGKVVSFDDPDLFKKTVHLKDIHLEKGMHCVDCHFRQDAHGTGKLIGDRRAAIEIMCQDCHGTAAATRDAGHLGAGLAETRPRLRPHHAVRRAAVLAEAGRDHPAQHGRRGQAVDGAAGVGAEGTEGRGRAHDSARRRHVG